MRASCLAFGMSTDARRTVIMGILNVTPDSFSDGGRHADVDAAVRHVATMLDGGADIIDIGGESTRPGAATVPEAEELRRVIPVIDALRRAHPLARLSLDTAKAAVARAGLEHGVATINSVGGFERDPRLSDVVAAFPAADVVLCHAPTNENGTLHEKDPEGDVFATVAAFFKRGIARAASAGIASDRIILDPGIGFGKTLAQNLALISGLDRFAGLGCRLLIGVSRKAHLATLLAASSVRPGPPEDRIEPGLAEAAIAVLHGATIVRTHDVATTRRFFAAFDAVRKDENSLAVIASPQGEAISATSEIASSLRSSQ